MQYELKSFRDLVNGDSSQVIIIKEQLSRKEQVIREQESKLAEVDNEYMKLGVEVQSLKNEKKRLEHDNTELKRQNEHQEKELRSRDVDMQRHDFKEEGIKSQLSQTNERLAELKDENLHLKQDKEKLFSKVDHLMFENETLRNEVFMLKKMMLERDMNMSSLPHHREPLREVPRPERRNVIMVDEQEGRRRPERPKYCIFMSSRSPIPAPSGRDQAPRFPIDGSKPTGEGRPATASEVKLSTKQSGKFNVGSEQSNIFTWDNPYHSTRKLTQPIRIIWR